VKAEIERYLAMVRENQTDGYLPCQHGIAENLQIRWRHKARVAPPPRRMPPRPRTPPVSSEDSESCATEDVPPGYVYIHSPLLSPQFFNLDPFAKDGMRDRDYIPDLLTDNDLSRG